uniref:Ig-like domain-containing protein n=1 Tax=Cyprinus carpio TaxID=7962 RepID=A0A8C1UHV4_CYPCA
MTLNVKEEGQSFFDQRLLVKPLIILKVMVNIGETANFSCEYSQNHINDPKMIFKEGKDSIEIIYSRWKKKERFSISDEKHKNIFSVRITAVTPDDGGGYLCGVWINRDSYIILGIKMKLNVYSSAEERLKYIHSAAEYSAAFIYNEILYI